MELWYDTHHKGAIRVINYKTQTITGSDPDCDLWTVPFSFLSKKKICIDFHSKPTHKKNKILYAKYHDGNSLSFYKTSNFEKPVNTWMKIGHDPTNLIENVYKNKNLVN